MAAFAVFVGPIAYLRQGVRSCRIVSVSNGFGLPSGVVAVAGGITGGVGDIDGDLVEVV